MIKYIYQKGIPYLLHGTHGKDEERRKTRRDQSMFLMCSKIHFPLKEAADWFFCSPSFSPLLPSHPPTLSTWTINSPSMLWACVQWTGGNESTEGEREKERDSERMCCVYLCSQAGRSWQIWPKGSTGLCWCVLVCVVRTADKEWHRAAPTPHPPPTWMACMVCTQQTRLAENPAGDQQLSTTLWRLQAKKSSKDAQSVETDVEADANHSITLDKAIFTHVFAGTNAGRWGCLCAISGMWCTSFQCFFS